MPAKSKSRRRGASSSKTLLDDLKKDHKEVKDLLKSILRSDDASEREEMFAKMKGALSAHSAAEEEMFYPLLEDEEDSRTDAL